MKYWDCEAQRSKTTWETVDALCGLVCGKCGKKCRDITVLVYLRQAKCYVENYVEITWLTSQTVDGSGIGSGRLSDKIGALAHAFGHDLQCFGNQ